MIKLWKHGISLFTLLAFLPLSGHGDSVNPWLRGQKRPFPFLIAAHRGASGYAPENTLPAFEKGFRMGAQLFELDVHLTKDGVPIVVHDDNLIRCSDVKTKFPNRAPFWVSDFTLEEIRQLDAGSWYVTEMNKPAQDRMLYLRSMTDGEKKQYIAAEDWQLYQSGQVKHPTLEEALLLAKRLDCFVNVEIKQMPRFYPDITAKVVKTIEATGMVAKVIISSFDHYQLVLSKQLNPNIATAILCVERIYDPGTYCTQLVKADAYHPGCYGNADAMGFLSVAYLQRGQLSLEAVDSALKAGLCVNAWTEDDPSHMVKLIQGGVTGIFSNFPNRITMVLNQLGAVK